MRIFSYLVVLIVTVGCNAEQAKHSKYTYHQLEPIGDFDKQQDTIFAQELQLTNLHLHVYGIKHPTATELVVHTDNGVKMLGEISKQLPGDILKIEGADLNKNDHPELYVWCETSPDTCALVAFEFLGNEITEITFPRQPESFVTEYILTKDELIQTAKSKNKAAITTRFQLDGKAHLVAV